MTRLRKTHVEQRVAKTSLKQTSRLHLPFLVSDYTTVHFSELGFTNASSIRDNWLKTTNLKKLVCYGIVKLKNTDCIIIRSYQENPSFENKVELKSNVSLFDIV